MEPKEQTEQVLIYIHQDIHKLALSVKVLYKTLKTINERIDSALETLETLEAKKNEPPGK